MNQVPGSVSPSAQAAAGALASTLLSLASPSAAHWSVGGCNASLLVSVLAQIPDLIRNESIGASWFNRAALAPTASRLTLPPVWVSHRLQAMVRSARRSKSEQIFQPIDSDRTGVFVKIMKGAVHVDGLDATDGALEWESRPIEAEASMLPLIGMQRTVGDSLNASVPRLEDDMAARRVLLTAPPPQTSLLSGADAVRAGGSAASQALIPPAFRRRRYMCVPEIVSHQGAADTTEQREFMLSSSMLPGREGLQQERLALLRVAMRRNMTAASVSLGSIHQQWERNLRESVGSLAVGDDAVLRTLPSVFLHPGAAMVLGQPCMTSSGPDGVRGRLVALRGANPATFLALFDLAESSIDLSVRNSDAGTAPDMDGGYASRTLPDPSGSAGMGVATETETGRLARVQTKYAKHLDACQ